MKKAKWVGIVDSCPIFLEGLRNILAKSGFELSFALNLLDPAVVDGVTSPPQILLVSITEGDLQPHLESASRLRAKFPGTKLVVLVDTFDKSQISQVWLSVDGLVLRTIGAEALIKALELVLLGERVLPGVSCDVMFAVGHGLLPIAANLPQDLPQLSPRELDVLRSLTAGSSNKVIARQIGVSEATVKVHMKGILRKLKVKNRTEAAVWARSHGLETQGAGPVGNSAMARPLALRGQDQSFSRPFQGVMLAEQVVETSESPQKSPLAPKQ